MGTSVGGVLTGRGADLILIDDEIKPSDAISESRRTAPNDWFDGNLYSRLNDKASSDRHPLNGLGLAWTKIRRPDGDSTNM
jgi:hypothetical protein